MAVAIGSEAEVIRAAVELFTRSSSAQRQLTPEQYVPS
jgi:hypothetical protein